MYDLPHLMPGGCMDHILYQDDGLVSQNWARLLSPDPHRRVSDHDPVHEGLQWMGRALYYVWQVNG
jgi:hypothetical protein